MKLPRGVSADRLIRALEQVGYDVIRQKGSHAKVAAPGTSGPHDYGPFAQSAENRDASRILAEVAFMRSITIESLSELL